MYTLRTGTLARFSSDFALLDVDFMLAQYDAANRGIEARGRDVFKRAAVVLLFTAWETYIEDTLSDVFGDRLAAANVPDDVLAACLTVRRWAADVGKVDPIMPLGKLGARLEG